MFGDVTQLRAAQARLTDPAEQARVDQAIAEAEAAEQATWAEARAEARARALADQRPLDFEQANMADLLPQQDPKRKVSAFLGSDARQLVLVGPSGHGKSWAAWALANEAVESISVAGWNVPDLIAALRTRDAHARHDTEAARRQDKHRSRLFTVGLLLLDDLGAERDDASFEHNEWRELLYRVIDGRAREGLRTVVTFNAESEAEAVPAVKSRYGARVQTRLYYRAWWAFIQGEQLRRVAPPWDEGGEQ